MTGVPLRRDESCCDRGGLENHVDVLPLRRCDVGRDGGDSLRPRAACGDTNMYGAGVAPCRLCDDIAGDRPRAAGDAVGVGLALPCQWRCSAMSLSVVMVKWPWYHSISRFHRSSSSWLNSRLRARAASHSARGPTSLHCSCRWRRRWRSRCRIALLLSRADLHEEYISSSLFLSKVCSCSWTAFLLASSSVATICLSLSSTCSSEPVQPLLYSAQSNCSNSTSHARISPSSNAPRSHSSLRCVYGSPQCSSPRWNRSSASRRPTLTLAAASSPLVATAAATCATSRPASARSASCSTAAHSAISSASSSRASCSAASSSAVAAAASAASDIRHRIRRTGAGLAVTASSQSPSPPQHCSASLARAAASSCTTQARAASSARCAHVAACSRAAATSAPRSAARASADR
eukprot:Rhum_TRINITY_DN466_c0_g1::Rhum_TRINITY_DN466_c0_g1_i1::g.1418::m.1418